MAISISFCINTNENECIEDRQLTSNLEYHKNSLLSNENFDGGISIESSPAQKVFISDELESLVQNLCFEAVVDLYHGKSVLINIFSYYGQVNLDVDEGVVIIHGTHIGKIFADKQQLIIALFECGLRFVGVFRHLRGNDVKYKDSITSLEMKAKQTGLVLFQK